MWIQIRWRGIKKSESNSYKTNNLNQYADFYDKFYFLKPTIKNNNINKEIAVIENKYSIFNIFYQKLEIAKLFHWATAIEILHYLFISFYNSLNKSRI